MSWVKRRPVPQSKHRCAPPKAGNPMIGYATGSLGDLWRCDECGTVWEIRDVNREHGGPQHTVSPFCKQWRRAGLWKQVWYGRERERS